LPLSAGKKPDVPFVDPRVETVGVTYLRSLNKEALRELDGVKLIQDVAPPLAVLLPYGLYIEIQRLALIGAREQEK
jgi:hypothetical protein